MPCHVPGSLDRLLSLLSPCFSQPTFQSFRCLVVGFIGRVGEHTVTGMWQAARLAGRVHHSLAHDFFARRCWSVDELGLRLLAFVLERLLEPQAPLTVAIDDTLFGRSGRRVWGAHYLNDASQPAGRGRRTRWGNCFVIVGLVLPLSCVERRPVCLPVLFRLFRPRGRSHPERLTQPQLARELVDLILARFPERRMHLVFDGAYASKAWRGLPARVSVSTRIRSNAAIYALPTPSAQRGRRRLKGPRLPSLAELARTSGFAPVALTDPDGRTRTMHAASVRCLWYGAFYTQPITLLLIRNHATGDGYDIAIATTDPDASTATTIERYASRWTIETAIHQAKAHGAGEARNRVKNAVQRTVPFAFLCQTITISWYQLHGNPKHDLHRHRQKAPWYTHKHTVSYDDILTALRRELIRAEFQAQAPHNPKPPKNHHPPPTLTRTAA
jgi:hypothetical protein